MLKSKIMKIRPYFVFFGVVIFLLCIPYMFHYCGVIFNMILSAEGIFYSLEIPKLVLHQLNLTDLLNIGIICSICLYFIVQKQESSNHDRNLSHATTIFFFSLVMISLFTLDFEYFIMNSPVEQQHLSMFGLLLSYFMIMLHIFQNNSNQVSFADVTNRIVRKLMSSSTTLLGLLLLLLPFSISMPTENFNPDSSLAIVTFYSSTNSFEIVNILGSSYNLNYITIIMGFLPIFFQFIFFWLPQIIFLILFLRFKSGFTSLRWFGLGILASFIPWIMMVLISLDGSSSLIFPLPLLQLVAYAVLVIENRTKSKSTTESLKDSPDDDFSPFVKVPISKIIISRMREWRSRK